MPSPEEELDEIYKPSPQTITLARKALQDYEDYRIFKAMPLLAGFEDQPGDWVVGIRLVTQAKEWSESIARLREEYKRANSGDEKNRDHERIDEVGAELEKLLKAHEERIEHLRRNLDSPNKQI